jgi:hypothetical protein
MNARNLCIFNSDGVFGNDNVRWAMTTLENRITEAAQIESDTARTLEGKTPADPSTVQ